MQICCPSPAVLLPSHSSPASGRVAGWCVSGRWGIRFSGLGRCPQPGSAHSTTSSAWEHLPLTYSCQVFARWYQPGGARVVWLVEFRFFYGQIGWSFQIFLACTFFIKAFAYSPWGFSFFSVDDELYKAWVKNLSPVGKIFPFSLLLFPPNIVFSRFLNIQGSWKNCTENPSTPTP